MSVTDEEYKYELALDVIFVLMKTLLIHKSNKIEAISYIIDAWLKNRKKVLEIKTTSMVQQIYKQTGCEVDVTSILLSANQIYAKTIQKEFANELKKLLISKFLKIEKMGR